MKALLIAVFVILCTNCYSQSSATQNPPSTATASGAGSAVPHDTIIMEREGVYRLVEQMPSYPGGEAAMMRFVQQHISYPDKEMRQGIQGRVIVKFIVNEDGSRSDMTVAKGTDSALDDEALRVIGLMPRFEPGRHNGVPVKVSFVLPIKFRLQ